MGDNMLMKERRLELGLTMKEIANAVGVSEATVSRWESGDIADMKRSRIINLAKILRVSPIDVLMWGGEIEEDPALLHRDAMIEHAVSVLNHSGYHVDFNDNDADVAVVKKNSAVILTSPSAIAVAYESFDQKGITPTAEQLLSRIENDPQPAQGRPEVTDDDIKFALFGTTEIDQDVYEDVKALARMYAERAQPKNKEKP